MNNINKKGFTLLEMSIVLVIIGTIVGAIMLGKTLLTNSRLQIVITDANSYILAINNFKQTYQSLPGDMAGATNIWGTASEGCPSGAGTGTQTCNGNGNGEIGPSGEEAESFRFWQHLSNAGLLTQSITGVPGTSNTAQPGVNAPAGPIKGSGFYIFWLGTMTVSQGQSGYYYAGSWGNVLAFGKVNPYNFDPAGAGDGSLTADQAASIDSKIDDGLPSSGTLRAARITNCTYDTVSGVTGYYTVNSSGPTCYLFFVPGL